MITVNNLIEHLTNVAKRGHGEVEVTLHTGVVNEVKPLDRGDIALTSTGKQILVLYPKS